MGRGAVHARATLAGRPTADGFFSTKGRFEQDYRPVTGYKTAACRRFAFLPIGLSGVARSRPNRYGIPPESSPSLSAKGAIIGPKAGAVAVAAPQPRTSAMNAPRHYLQFKDFSAPSTTTSSTERAGSG